MNNNKIREIRFNPKILLMVFFFLSASPIIFTLNIKISLIIIILFIYLISKAKLIFTYNAIVIYVSLFIFLITSIITSSHNNTLVPFYYVSMFCIVCLISMQINQNELKVITKILTKIFIFLLIGAWLSYIYFIIGGKPFFSLSNPDGRTSYFVLSTFSNTLDPFRPAGIYDEPGAFSFYICLLVTLRSLQGENIIKSAILLVLGLITQSIAHIGYLLVWFVGLFLLSKNFQNLTLKKKIIIAFFALFLISLIYYSGFLDWAINRALYYSDNPAQTGRIPALVYIYDRISLNYQNLLFGFDIGCVNRTDCYFGENFLTPLVYGGLFAAWPYYLFLFFLILIPIINKKYYFLFGLAIILLQRPYFLELPYSLSICLILNYYVHKQKKL